jgi:DNA invertase Pin-like site-specific DNA recombinase
MMREEASQKVTAHHLGRPAYLYVRQSTVRQVFENTESSERQYALRRRAIALGWPDEQIVVVDCDQGHSAASVADREGFQKLVGEVSLARVGIVMGLEVSRLARNSSDWHRLLEMCALTETLILDEDGVYDPTHFNDRLLLGLKGTMSEAELHVLRARLRGGLLNKAQRGDLPLRLPVGFVLGPDRRVVLDPDAQVQGSIRLLFEVFARVGSAHGVAKHFREHGLPFPTRVHTGPCRGDLVWLPLGESRALHVLRNPRYAGAYAFGKSATRRTGDGRTIFQVLPRDRWHTLIPGAHDGYITWPQYEQHQQQIADNAQALGADRRLFVPREGPALLQGLAVCGRCGNPMSVRYHARRGGVSPDYVCRGMRSTLATPMCQALSGAAIDQAIGDLLIAVMSPVALEVTVAVEQELRARAAEADQLRRQQVDRARYEAELARRRYMQVDPANRLVADALEADWNTRLRTLAAAQEDYERRRAADPVALDAQLQAQILALARDFPRLWRDPSTPDRERKRLARLLLEDVTLLKGATAVAVHARFKGGATHSLTLPRAKAAWEEHQTRHEVVALIDRLLDEHTDGEAAAILNARGLVSGTGKPFSGDRVATIRRAYRLKDRATRLRAAGLVSLDEVAETFGVKPWVIKSRRLKGQLPITSLRLDDQGQYMYERPAPGTSLHCRRSPARAEEVQNA